MNNLSILFFNMEFASDYLAVSIILDRHIYSTDTFDKIISNTDNTDLPGYLLLDSAPMSINGTSFSKHSF